MDDKRPPPVSDATLDAVNDAMVALHARYHGHEPASAHTRVMGDDMLACMLGDVYTDIEKTMIELQRQALVHETLPATARRRLRVRMVRSRTLDA